MAESASPARWNFVRYHDSGEREVYPITKPVTSVGRDDDNDIQIDDLHVSRHHVRLTQKGDQLIIEDLGTANGTLVNGGELAEPYPLQVGDTVDISSFTFLVEGQSYPYLQLQETRRVQPVVAPPPAAPDSQRWIWLMATAIGIGIILVGLLAFLTWRLFRPVETDNVAQISASLTPASPSTPAIVVSQSPAINTELQINHSVTIQAIASDPSGVARVELWVNGQKVDQVASSLSQNAPSMTAAFQWTPETAGTYTLELRAYNQPGRVSQTVVTTVTAVPPSIPAVAATSTATPSPTATPLPPTETATPEPSATSTSTPVPATATPVVAQLVLEVPALNVRSGPGTQYSVLGTIAEEDNPEIMGQANAGQGRWWLIRFAGAPDGFGWVTGDADFTRALNAGDVPQVSAPRPPAVAAAPTPTIAPTATSLPSATPTALSVAAIQPPEGKMLLIVSNRSQEGVPARLTLSGGRSVGGGQEIDPPVNGQVELVLEPDFYRALWSSPARNFTRGVDFTAVPGKVMVMWIVPEEGVTSSETYDELVLGPAVAPELPVAMPTASEVSSPPEEPEIPAGKALLIVENRSVENEFAYLTISEGNFGGGHALTLDAGTQHTFEIIPDHYRTTWSAPAGGGMSMNREFVVKAGDVAHAWVVPERREVVIEVGGQRVN